ncbi:MAG TPA: citrate lyase subunit alpha, partial [Burkholderiaceae bacterium]|nr:citrate lyase subunit alpha [Burkholderiaceae bacterium]
MRTRELPTFIEGYGPVRPFAGAESAPAVVTRAAARVCPAVSGRDKVLHDIDAAFDACNIRSGATVSFH